MRTAAESSAMRIQAELVMRQALFDESLVQQASRHHEEQETMRLSHEHESLDMQSCQVEQVKAALFANARSSRAVALGPFAIPTAVLHVKPNFTSLATDYFDTVQWLHDNAVCTTEVSS
jgi:hypothetical protein